MNTTTNTKCLSPTEFAAMCLAFELTPTGAIELANEHAPTDKTARIVWYRAVCTSLQAYAKDLVGECSQSGWTLANRCEEQSTRLWHAAMGF